MLLIPKTPITSYYTGKARVPEEGERQAEGQGEAEEDRLQQEPEGAGNQGII